MRQNVLDGGQLVLLFLYTTEKYGLLHPDDWMGPRTLTTREMEVLSQYYDGPKSLEHSLSGLRRGSLIRPIGTRVSGRVRWEDEELWNPPKCHSTEWGLTSMGRDAAKKLGEKIDKARYLAYLAGLIP